MKICVLVKGNMVISQGYTQASWLYHAEAGIKMLRDAGIAVVVELLAEEAAEDFAEFLVSKSGDFTLIG